MLVKVESRTTNDELIDRIRSVESASYTYIILLTAKSEKEDLVQAMEAGADDFLIKPCDSGELRVRVREGERISEPICHHVHASDRVSRLRARRGRRQCSANRTGRSVTGRTTRPLGVFSETRC